MHNNVLYNAAFDGAFAASNDVPTTASQTARIAACEAFAAEVDELIPNDPNLSNLDGTTLVPSNGRDEASQANLTSLLQDLCFSAVYGHPLINTNGEAYEAMATNIAATYLAAKAELLLEPAGPTAPVYPSLPSGTVLQLLIDAGRDTTGGNLNSWTDQSSNGFVFTALPDVPFELDSNIFQNHDGQASSSNANAMTNTGGNCFPVGSPRTFMFAGRFLDGGAAIDPILVVGSTAALSGFFSGGGIYYSNGAESVSGPVLYTGQPHIMTWMVTPDGSANAQLFINGWPVNAANAGSDLSGNVGADGTHANMYLAHMPLAPSLAFDGDDEENLAWDRRLNSSDHADALGFEVGRLQVCGVKGYVNDAQSILPLGLEGFGHNFLATQALAVHSFYTTSTTFDVYVQNSTGLGSVVDVFIDGEYDHSIAVTASITPLAYSVTSAKMDGRPHLVEVWNSLYFQLAGSGIEVVQVTRMQDPTGNTKIYPATPGKNVMVPVGDSIGNGYEAGNTNTTFSNGWFAKMRWAIPQKWNGRVAFYTSSGRALYTDFVLDNTLMDAAQRICAQSAFVQPGGLELIVIQYGTNDYGGAGAFPGQTPPGWADINEYQTALALLVSNIHSLRPNAQILLLGEIVRNGETMNNAASGTPFNLAAIRAAKAAVAAANPAFCKYEDASQPFNGMPAITLANLPDGIHPDAVGYSDILFPWIAEVIAIDYPAAA